MVGIGGLRINKEEEPIIPGMGTAVGIRMDLGTLDQMYLVLHPMGL